MAAYLNLLDIFLPKEEKRREHVIFKKEKSSIIPLINRLPNQLTSFSGSYCKPIFVYEKEKVLLEELERLLYKNPETNIKELFSSNQSTLLYSLRKGVEEQDIVLTTRTIVRYSLEDLIFRKDFHPYVKTVIESITESILNLDPKLFACTIENSSYVYNSNIKSLSSFDLEDYVNKSLDKIKQKLMFIFIAYHNNIIPFSLISKLIFSYSEIAQKALDIDYTKLTKDEINLRKNLFCPLGYLFIMFYAFIENKEIIIPVTISKSLSDNLCTVILDVGTQFVNKKNIREVHSVMFDTCNKDYVFIDPQNIIDIGKMKFIHEKDFIKPMNDGGKVIVDADYLVCLRKNLIRCDLDAFLYDTNLEEKVVLDKDTEPRLYFRNNTKDIGIVNIIMKKDFIDASLLSKYKTDNYRAISSRNLVDIKKTNLYNVSTFKLVKGKAIKEPYIYKSSLFDLDIELKNTLISHIQEFYTRNKTAIRKIYPSLYSLP